MKKIFKLIISLIILLPINVYANMVINGNEFTVYKRTKQEIYNKWIVGKINQNISRFDTLPQYTAPYKAGVANDEYLAEVVDNLNYYRYLVGVPEITESTSNDNSLQTAEVIQTLFVDKYNALTHELYNYEEMFRPSDMSDEFWNVGAYAKHHIISYGRPDEPNFYFFDESIFDPVYPQAGHRMALLTPNVIKEDYGIGELTIYGRSTLNDSNYNLMNNSFAAYPSPGYFPKEDFANTSDWDIFLNRRNFRFLTAEEQEKVIVTITDLKDNTVYIRNLENENLVFDYYCEQGSCANRMNILQPDKQNGAYYDGNYKVHVSNLKNNSGDTVDIEYIVNFYNKMEGTTSNVVEAKPFIDKLYFDGGEDLEFLNTALEDVFIELTLDNGNTFNYTPSGYNINQYGTAGYGTSVYHAYPIVDNLPDYIKDNSNIIKNKYIVIQCNSIPSTYKMTYGITDYSKNIGSNITFGINGIKYDFNGYGLYTWIHEKDDNYFELENNDKYISSDNNMETYSLTINDLDKEDAGNYYFGFVLFDDTKKYYYISKPINLNIIIPVESISFTTNSINLNKGESLKLNPTVNPTDANSELIWTTSDYQTVSVDDEGNITAIKEGNAIITVSSGSVNTKITINVQGYDKGDMNKDGVIGLSDVIKLLKLYLGVELTTEEDIELGDMNDDGTIGLSDVITLLKTYLGVI